MEENTRWFRSAQQRTPVVLKDKDINPLTHRHRICNCMTSDGWSPFGKPIRCIKKGNPIPQDSQALIRHDCLAGCGHDHMYSPEYLLKAEIAEEINRLGLEKSLELLKGAYAK